MDDPDPSGVLGQILLLFILILLNAFFAMSEIAVISLGETKIERWAAGGDRRARRIRRLSQNSGRFLSMIQLGVTLAGFLASYSSARSFGAPLERALLRILPPGMHGFAGAAVTAVITLAISYLTLVLGELVPKRMALKYPERIALRVSGPLGMFSALLRPLVWVVSASANGVLRLLGVDPEAGAGAVTEEEIRMMVDAGGEKGVIEDTQKEMINNIFEFGDLSAGDIMTHRTDIVGVEANEALENVVRSAMEEGVSRIPVYEGDIDTMIGVVYIKDLLGYIGEAMPQKSPREIMREACFVPESKRLDSMFKEMTAMHIQIAIVVDEYGGTAGLVTLEDILESIVGNIQDEYDDEEEEVRRVDENTFLLEGATDFEEVEALTGVALPQGEYDTVAGFVISLLGYLPGAEERPAVEYENLRFTVEEMEDRRIASLRVEIIGGKEA